jgi:L-threonylcarbamoyladenylate synthase
LYLFAVLRALDRSDCDIILAEHFPDEGLGRAINDRLGRASASR